MEDENASLNIKQNQLDRFRVLMSSYESKHKAKRMVDHEFFEIALEKLEKII